MLDGLALEFARLGATPKLLEFFAATYLRMPTEQIVHFKLLPVILGYAELGIPKEITEILISKCIESGDINTARKAAKIAGRKLSAEEIIRFDDFIIKAAEANAESLKTKEKVLATMGEIKKDLRQIASGYND